MRQIDNHPREKAGFSNSQKEPGSVELSSSVHKARQNRDDSPRNHDACDPFSCTPAFDDDGSRDLEQEPRYVKHGYAQAINAVTETQIGAHPEVGEGNVGAVNIVNDKEKKDKRKQAVRDSPSGSLADIS